ncbi:MAG: tetratricopeptide repeat protein [Planctomycetes bacterium]|nr:tetratricopeptide repeat protein [Planctomycetota bacterium]
MRILLLLALLAVPRAEDPPRPSAAALWARGARLEAIEAARTELGAAPTTDAWVRLVAWQLTARRHRAALEDAERCGPPCDAQRAEALYRLGEFERALPLFDERDPVAALWKIDALEALGRFAESDAVLERARAGAQAGDPRLHAADGRSAARRGDLAGAERAFRAALALEPFDGESLFGLGRALVAAGRRAEGLAVLAEHRRVLPLLDAVEFARQGLDLAPAHAPNWTALGDAERALPRLDRAEAAYRRAASIAHGDEAVANALRWARLLAEDRGDVDAAVDLLARTSRAAPDARLLVRAGDLLLAAHRPREAAERFAQALALRPDDAQIARRLAAARATEGR